MTSGPDVLPLTAALVARDEADRLPAWCRGLSWAAERLVVDTGSRDATADLAGSLDCAVIRRPDLGWAAARRLALESAGQDWVLFVDADEAPDAGLENALRRLDWSAPDPAGYMISILSHLGSRPIRHAWGPDWHLRLVRRDRALVEEAPVHERLRLRRGMPARLAGGRLLHHPYRDLGQWLDKMGRYADLAAALPGPPRSWASIGLGSLLIFLKHYLLKGGFRDGDWGILFSQMRAGEYFLKHARRRERHEA